MVIVIAREPRTQQPGRDIDLPDDRTWRDRVGTPLLAGLLVAAVLLLVAGEPQLGLTR